MMDVMGIFSWNVNGIRAVHKKGHFLPFIEKHQPDILCLQETKAEQHESPLDLPDYKEFWHSAETKKGYSGTAIFSKEEPHEILFGLPDDLIETYKLDRDSYGNPNKEGRCIAAEFDDLFIVSVYTPNAKDDLSRLKLRHQQWDPAFLAYMKRLEKKKPVVFCGDLNVAHKEIDLARPKENEGRKGFTKEEREGIDEIVGAGFIDTFRVFTKDGGHYTWWTHWANARARNIGWRIDYVFVSPALKKRLKKAFILPEVMGSDHCPVGVKLSA